MPRHRPFVAPAALAALSVVAALLPAMSLAANPPAPSADQHSAQNSATARLAYPVTRQVDQVDTYHGQRVADPYRWLEDDNSPETAAWAAAENRLTESELARIPFREALKARVEKLVDHPRFSAPTRRGQQFYFSANSGLQNQNVIYVQPGLAGTPEVLLDPNTFSADGTTRLDEFSLQPSGRLAVYASSIGGSDWKQLRVLDLASKKTLDDRIDWVKVSGVAWHGDGFFYSRYPAPEKGRELSSSNDFHQVWFHRIGTPQSADELIFEDRAHTQRFHMVTTTEDQRFAVLSVSERGKGLLGNALFVRDLRAGADAAASKKDPKGEKPGEAATSPKADTRFAPLVPEIGESRFSVVGNVAGQLLVNTNRGAPNGRIVRIDPQDPAEARWVTVVPERPEPLQDADLAGGKLFVTYLKDVTTRAWVMAPDGTQSREITLPGLGTAAGFGGNHDDTSVFYSFSSFSVPATVYRYDIAKGESSVFKAPQLPGFNAADYETRQVFYPSKDGTRVPMFLVHKKGLKLDGQNPTLLYGYGGFNVTVAPSFSATRLALLEQGVVYAVANLRGGGEYGEAWHMAGTKLRKQNVFDDFIAAAEWLIANKVSSPAKLAVQGGSNGGLLVGAVINQRPELFKVALPAVGVMDMLRFHKFTIGWNWVADYGSSDDAEQFKALYAYSPLHNIRAGGVYPATLITTADHDDRVVPAHSFKYAATLQAKASPASPVLIRIDTQSGHGASNTTKQIETAADIYAFLLWHLGVQPQWSAPR